MKIRIKMFLVVLPLVIATLTLAQAASYFNAVNGVTRLAREFLGFKLAELERYADNQWSLLVENNFAGRPDMVEAAQIAVGLYAESIVLSATERIFALDGAGNVGMQTGAVEMTEAERNSLMAILRAENPGLQEATIGGERRVFQSFYFVPFDWFVLISERHDEFYRDANLIRWQAVFTLIAAVALISIFLVIMSGRLTGPLSRMVKTMDKIIGSADLSSRVEVEYQDETGILASTFNRMLGELDRAYAQIKRYAFDAVMAAKKEERIRHIFQKYVPKAVIDKFFASPEKMLVGDNRNLSVLFSDIRSFTTISEGMSPDDLVNSLNRYFSGQVDIIYNRNGVVDKYIGDAIMAFWGAPGRHEDDALQSVLAGLDMIDSVSSFNERQRELGKPEFHVGVGINFGEVTVGNIGSDRKMDYTVIGDSVNLASRMEGLTKTYHSLLLISEFVYDEMLKHGIPPEENLRFRLLDTVAVKGKTKGVKIYTVKNALTPAEESAWPLHNEAMELYYARSFREAAAKFKEASVALDDDLNAESMYHRCMDYDSNPPPEGWDGVEVMQSK